ncbi:MAG: fibronectin type III domain-containing protein [Chloroflexi bacterium]|nr:fibronectin type III domain-containing protein [Chloroflexota bacterium]
MAHFAGAPNDVYTTVTTWGSDTNERILRYNGTSWSVVLTDTRAGDYGPSLVYISANEIYGTTCWGHWLWNGSTWAFIQQFDFCDAASNWGMRDAQGILQLYNSGNNNFTNGPKVWKFAESSTGSKSGSWGSKSGYVFSDGSCGTARGMWGSAGNDVWAVGSLYFGGTPCGAGPNNEGRIYRFNGTLWGRVTTPFDPLPLYVTAVSGTAPDDVWVANNARLLHFAPLVTLTAPTAFQAVLQGDNNVSLSWKDNAIGETAYYLWRWAQVPGWSFVGVLDANASFSVDSGLASGTTYTYFLAASSGSAYSDWASTSVALPALTIRSPSDFLVQSASGSLRLQWKDNASNENGFELWRWDEATGWKLLV